MQVLKSCLPSAVLYSCKSIQPYHFLADLILCDGTFKARKEHRSKIAWEITVQEVLGLLIRQQ